MPPEEPGKVIAFDLTLNDGVLIANGEMIYPADKNLRVSWYAQNVPQNYQEICGGVAHAFEPSISYSQPLADMIPTQVKDLYYWREPVREDGIMFILVLPRKKTITQVSPIPIEAKVFDNRIALFWLAWPDEKNKRYDVTFEWNLINFEKDISLEVEDVNSLILSSTPRPDKTEYDVALSYAGEDRAYVEIVAAALQEKGIKVFYDKYERASMWGKNLYDHLSDVYGQKSQYTVMFISEHYRSKNWTNFERETAQARAFADNREYILPVRFDETQLPGMLNTTAYVSADEYAPKELAELIVEKISS